MSSALAVWTRPTIYLELQRYECDISVSVGLKVSADAANLGRAGSWRQI